MVIGKEIIKESNQKVENKVTNQWQEREEELKSRSEQSKVAEQAELQEDQWHKWKPCLSHKQEQSKREREREREGESERVWKHGGPLNEEAFVFESGKLTWLSNKSLHVTRLHG